MKKNFLIFIILLLISSCGQSEKEKQIRQDFSENEKLLLKLSRDIIQRSYYTTLITLDGKKPHPRIMEPFLPDENWVIWLGTNSRSRKVKEIRKNPVAVLHYFDRNIPAYVNLYGNAYLVDDPVMKDSIWREAWSNFYPGKNYYTLIRFIPDSLEMIHPGENLSGDSVTWKPYSVILRK